MQATRFITPELSRLVDGAREDSELIRAIEFFDNQRAKSWTVEEALLQVLGSYGERTHYRISSMVVSNQLL